MKSLASRGGEQIDAMNPLTTIEDWEDFMEWRYAEENQKLATVKKRENYRNYDQPARDCVRHFYRQNHINQTLDFVGAKRNEFWVLNRREMGVWEAIDYLNTLIDDSDPDTELSQLEHLLQTAEAIRADGYPDWFILTGLIHDLGKTLCLYGEPQWAVVGDTYPVGCAFSDKIVYPEFFSDNPDSTMPQYKSQCGMYEGGSGLSNIYMSWGA